MKVLKLFGTLYKYMFPTVLSLLYISLTFQQSVIQICQGCRLSVRWRTILKVSVGQTGGKL